MAKKPTGLDSPDPDIFVRALYPKDIFLADYKCPEGHNPRARWESIKRKKRRKDRQEPKTSVKQVSQKALNWENLKGLLEIQCLIQEIETVLHMDEDTLSQRCQILYGQTWAEWSSQYRSEGKISLRRVMHQKAVIEKDTVMLKHLSTHYLGMGSEQAESAQQGSKKIIITFQDLKNNTKQGVSYGKPTTP